MDAIPLRVVCLESRREEEMARMLERRGATVLRAPSMREVPLADQTEALAFGEVLFAGGCDVLVLLTGVGTRMLVDALATRWPRVDVATAIGRTTLCCRGPKPVAALKDLGLRPAVLAPEPNTWRELVGAMEALELTGRRVWVQEYGRRNESLLAALRARGADVRAVPIYAWRLPEDTTPLARGLAALCDGGADAVVFTSAHQLDNLLAFARAQGRAEAMMEALQRRVLVASIGPVTSDALREAGIAADMEPEHPKMGHLVLALAAEGAAKLTAKRTR
jgi:uroporphyrinogen-III synthase